MSKEFLSLEITPELLAAFAAIEAAPRQHPHDSTKLADPQWARELIAAAADKAVLSEAGRKAFPEWAQEVELEADRLCKQEGRKLA